MLVSSSISFGTSLCLGSGGREEEKPLPAVETNYKRQTTDFTVGKSTSLISDSEAVQELSTESRQFWPFVLSKRYSVETS